MNLMVRKEKETAGNEQRGRAAGRQVLEDLLRFLADLTLPVSSKRPAMQLVRRGERQESTPDYLLIRSEEAALFNAGYLAGQAVSFLRFRGIDASPVRDVPRKLLAGSELSICGMSAREPALADRRYVAAVAFGGAALRRERRRGGGTAEYQCICRESGIGWCRELLHAVKEQAPTAGAYVCTGREADCLHVRSRRGGRSQQSAFEAGMTLAAVMSAAERLWIELEFISLPSSADIRSDRRARFMRGDRSGVHCSARLKKSHGDYYVSVCRREDYDRLMTAEQAARIRAGEKDVHSLGYRTLAYRI